MDQGFIEAIHLPKSNLVQQTLMVVIVRRRCPPDVRDIYDLDDVG